MDQKILIWKDAHDKDLFVLGVKGLDGNYYAWTSIFGDGLFDFFGDNVFNELNCASPGKPYAITYTIKSIEEQIWVDLLLKCLSGKI